MLGWNFVHIKITGADVSATVNRLCESDIILHDVWYENLLCVRASVSYRDYVRLNKLVSKSNDSVIVHKTGGIFLLLNKMINRPVLAVLTVSMLLLSLWVPSRIFFIKVEGNRNVLATRILQEAENCGIYFGAQRTAVRSENIKNNLLEAMPELQWVGVNTKGCVAVISIREDLNQKRAEEAVVYSNIVAERDGIVISATVTSGAPACAPGDAVKKDQVLVSGWQDLGLLVKTTRAVGEIVAQTERELKLNTPLAYMKTGSKSNSQTSYSVIIGKNRINLSKNSGIYYTGCDKIYTSYYLTLPGGFVLPLAFETEHTVVYNNAPYQMPSDAANKVISEQADRYLLSQTVSGVIQNRHLYFTADDTMGRTFAKYTCVEIIGRERTGELNIHYGENDGTNR